MEPGPERLGPKAAAAAPFLAERLKMKEQASRGCDWQVRLAMAKALTRVSPKDVETAREGLHYVATQFQSGREAPLLGAASLAELELERELALAFLLLTPGGGDNLGLLGFVATGLTEARAEKVKALAPLLRAVEIGGELGIVAPALRRFGAVASSTIPFFVRAVGADPQGREVSVPHRLAAAVNVANFSPRDAPTAVTFFGEAILGHWDERDYPLADRRTRQAAAAALGELGSVARPAVPALLQALKGPGRTVRQTAADALKKIDPEAATRAGVR